MNMTFSEGKQELLKSILIFEKFARQKNKNNQFETISDLKEKLENNKFNLVVLGQFKRGKTTLINSLISEDILPVAVVPLTSIVTIIKHGINLKIVVHFIDRKKQEITREELIYFVTEKGNPANEKGVDFVEISYPSSFLKDGVQLIDTPGVGSVYKHNTDIAYQYLPKVDGAIFLVAADPPISQSEHQYISDIKEYAKKIFFLQNKIDHVDETERKESLEFTKKVIEEEIGIKGITIYPISAKLALEGKKNGDNKKLEKSYLPEFESALNKFLMEEKGNIILASASSALLRLINIEINSIEIERKALQIPINELKLKLKAFNEASVKFEEDKDDLNYLLKGEIKKIMNGVDMHIEVFKKDELGQLKNEIQGFLSEQRSLSLKDAAKNLELFFVKKIEEKFNPFRNNEEKFAIKSFEKVVEKFSNQVNGLIDEIYKVSGELFGVVFEKYEGEDIFSMESDFYYLVTDIKVGIEMIAFGLKLMLPKAISHRLLLKEAFINLESTFDRQCGRVRWDILERLQESTFRFESRLKGRIDAAIEGIKQAVQRASDEKLKGEEKAVKSIVMLDEMLSETKDIKKTLQNFLNHMGHRYFKKED